MIKSALGEVEPRPGMVIKDLEFPDELLMTIDSIDEHFIEVTDTVGCKGSIEFGACTKENGFGLMHAPFDCDDWVIDTVTGVEARVCRAANPDWIDVVVSEGLPAQRIAITPELVHKDPAMRDHPDWKVE